jgi:S1-C subfamily serine protease
MSAEEPETQLALRREALLPNERGRGLGTVAVVCTMAGVASGLALATTLMAMQVADSMSVRNCPYRVVATEVAPLDIRVDHGFLGISYDTKTFEVDKVLAGTPAEAVNLHKGDRLLTIDGAAIHSVEDVEAHILEAHPGTTPEIVFERDGVRSTVRPTLIAPPLASY